MKKPPHFNPINLNDFAATVCEHEGGEENLSIAQVKEVLSITFRLLSHYKPHQVLEVIDRYTQSPP